MTQLFPVKPAFVSGQISPRLFGRIDIEQYGMGLEQCKNFIVFPHGGAAFRSGTRFIGEVKDHANYVRLIPFIFNNEQAYILETGLNYIRIYDEYALIESSPGTPLELTTTYTLDEVDKLRFDQSGDIMYAVVRTKPPQEIQRLGATSWNFTDFVFQDGPYLDVNTESTTLTPSATTGSITITASSVTGINDGDGFLSTDVGRLIRLEHSSTWGWVEITAVGSTTSITATVHSTLGGTGATSSWRLGAWSDTTGWPEAVQFHQQRLFFARGQFIWGSRTGEFDNFSPSATDGTVRDDDGVTYRLAAGRIDLIQWLSSSRVLEVGSAGAEFTLTGGGSFGLDSPLTPDSVLARKTTEIGSFTVSSPVFATRGTVFINRSGRKLINYYYDFSQDNYVGTDITLLSEDITYPSVFELAYQAEPDLLIHALRGDGTLLSCTFNPAQDVVGWHQHEFGGSYDGGIPVVESIAVIPSSAGPYDELWLSILRTIDGNEVRYVEVMENMFSPISAIEDAYFVDSGLSYDGSPASDFTGLEHLEGETVTILADGSVHPSRVVTGGEVSLDRDASVVHIGLPYQGKLILPPFEPGNLGDSLISRKTRVTQIGLMLYRTILGEAGIEGQRLEIFNGRLSTDLMDTPIEPRTDFVRVPVESQSEYRNRITVEQNFPLPCTVLAVFPIIEQ